MKNVILLVSLFFTSYLSFSQAVYVDPVVASAMLVHDSNLKTSQNNTNSVLTSIRNAETMVQVQLQVAHNLQQKVYDGLSNVSSLLNDAYYVKSIYTNCERIISTSSQIAVFASQNPQFAIFANKHANEFKRRATLLTTETITTLTGGELNLMNSGQRRELVRDIHMQTSLLASTSYLMLFTMEKAKMNGFWNTLNPFSGHINRDRRIAQDIMNKAKGL